MTVHFSPESPWEPVPLVPAGRRVKTPGSLGTVGTGTHLGTSAGNQVGTGQKHYLTCGNLGNPVPPYTARKTRPTA